MNPRVSIIMAVKNAERYLAQALESIQAQSFSDYEIILVDASSTDRTVVIAKTFMNVRVLQQTGVGFADAWNCGISEARGEFVSLLDSDDVWDREKLALQAAYLNTHPDIDCVIGHVRFFADPQVQLPATFRPSLLEGSYLAHMPGAMMVRRSVFSRIGLFDPEMRVASDIDWFAKLKDAGIREGVIDRVVIHKRVHETNVSYTGAKDTKYDRELLETLRRSIVRQRAAAIEGA